MAIDAFCFRSFSGTFLVLNYAQKVGITDTTEDTEEEFENNSVQFFEIYINLHSVNTEVMYSNWIFLSITISIL